ncbi:MAG: hypothetical protein Q8874_02670 [Sweet potato little leaf phytoplasma]|nr:hypothetical protein [Sweet potato little leaf phytoplasma]
MITGCNHAFDFELFWFAAAAGSRRRRGSGEGSNRIRVGLMTTNLVVVEWLKLVTYTKWARVRVPAHAVYFFLFKIILTFVLF